MNDISITLDNAAPDGWIAGGSHKPLTLAGARGCWIVRRGHYDIFAVAVGAAGGRRHHLFRAHAGDILPGVDADENGYGLLAVGSLDSATEPVSPDVAVDIRGLERWIAELSAAATEPLAEWPQAIVTAGSIVLADGERLSADPQQAHWLEVTAGGIRLLDGGALVVGQRIPLAGRTWVAAAGATHLRAECPDRVRPRDLTLFNALALAAAGARIQRRIGDDLRIAAASRGATRHEFESALQNLAGVAARRGRAIAAAAGDPLAAALRVLLQALHFKPAELAAAYAIVVGTAGRGSANERLATIAHQLRLGRRQVLLRKDLVAEQGPPLLAWRGADRTPVALVFHDRRGWEMIDDEEALPLNGEAMDELHAEAVQLYATLPAGALRFGQLFSFGRPETIRDLIRVGCAAMAVALLGMSTPIWSHYLMDSIIPDGRVNLLAVVIGALVVTALTTATFEFVKSVAVMRVQARLEARLQPALMDRLIRLPTGFYRKFTVGDITDRALGIQSAREALSGSVAGAFLGGVFGIMSLVPLFHYDSRLALVALGLTLLTCVIMAGLSYGRLRHEREELRHQGRLEGFVVQMLVGVVKLRAAAAEARALAQWSRYFVAQRDRFVAAERWQVAQGTVMTFLPVATTAVLYIAILTIMRGGSGGAVPTAAFSAADFVAFSTAYGQVMGALSGVTSSLTRLLLVIPMIERSKPILDTPIEMTKDAELPGVLTGAIELKHIKFRYVPDGPLVLDDVTLRIEPGQFVALVGPSGSGKSTIARLILGFERAELGEIFFGPKAAERLDMGAVRQQIGVVLQHGRLSSGSIYDNIVGDVGLGIEQAWVAARMVGLDKDIEQMPMGMHTVLLDGGQTLSGGQRQRILLARALVHQPRILLLDEATSALDNRTQAIVTETLGKLSTTRIVIAHRLSTIQAVDRIFVLERGRVIESGTYAELMERDGSLAALAKRQIL